MPSRLTFAVLLGLALCIRLAYVFFLPLGQSVRFRLEGLNDEPSHLNYVHYLAEHKSFPVQHHHARETDSFVRNEFEYFQPPVYYLIGAGCELLFGKSRSMLVCRFLSFVFGVLSLLVIKRIFSMCGFSAPLIGAAVLFAAFFPTHAYFCSVVSNDSLSWLFALLLTVEMVKIKKPDVSASAKQVWTTSVLTGTLLGVGTLIKSSLFIFYPVMALLFLYRSFYLKKLRWIGGLIASLLLSGLISAPWYIYNMHLYGSFFAFGIGNGPPQFFLFSGRHLINLIQWTIAYFWFPMQHVPASHAAGGILWCETLILLCNGTLCVLYIGRQRGFSFWKLLLCFLVLVNIAAYIKFNLWWSNAEGRYFLPSFVPFILFFCVPPYYYCKRFGLERIALPLLCAEALFPYVNLLLVR